MLVEGTIIQNPLRIDYNTIVDKRTTYGAFTLDVKSMLIYYGGGILSGTQCRMADSLMLSEC